MRINVWARHSENAHNTSENDRCAGECKVSAKRDLLNERKEACRSGDGKASATASDDDASVRIDRAVKSPGVGRIWRDLWLRTCRHHGAALHIDAKHLGAAALIRSLTTWLHRRARKRGGFAIQIPSVCAPNREPNTALLPARAAASALHLKAAPSGKGKGRRNSDSRDGDCIAVGQHFRRLAHLVSWKPSTIIHLSLSPRTCC
ncbi:hypothetical protein L1887_58121 [Cichorium endivia]|nr:hypothetical protein L1887_58121 [Cichorium endivia]